MNKLFYVLTFIFLLNFSSLYAQMPEEGIFSVYGSLGIAPVKTNSATIYFGYVDESPSRDNMTSEIDISKQSMALDIQGGVEYQKKHLALHLAADYMAAKAHTFVFDIGAGYRMYSKNGKMRITPGISLLFGSNDISLGQLTQNDVYIQVNNQKFYSDQVSVSLSSGVTLLKPNVQLNFPVSESIDFMTQIGYILPLSHRTANLAFSGQDEEGNNVTASESLSADNVNLYVSNNKITQTIVNNKGVSANVGLVLHF